MVDEPASNHVVVINITSAREDILMCKSCQKIQEYFEKEEKLFKESKPRLAEQVGEDTLNIMEHMLKFYKKVVDKTVKAF